MIRQASPPRYPHHRPVLTAADSLPRCSLWLHTRTSPSANYSSSTKRVSRTRSVTDTVPMETDGIGEDGSAGQHSPRRSHVPLSGPGDTEENIDGEMPHHESAFFQCEDSAPILSWPNNQNEVNPRGLLGKWHSMESH
ncbi:hypothetical protein O3P69_009786 [Scylla paramamosain]|uniref:Uncharacterized protein n=1 Tax=Scylla paramamosain TaxID=85552 RepID=A0AAW0SML0_SCYPA